MRLRGRGILTPSRPAASVSLFADGGESAPEQEDNHMRSSLHLALKTFLCTLLTSVLTAVGAFGDGGGSAPMTPEEFAAVNSANRQALRTARVSAVISEVFKGRPEEEEEARQRMIDAYARSQDTALESALADGADDQALERIRGVYDRRLNSVDDAMLVRRLNKSLRIARTSQIDFAGQQARYDDTDLRDLVALAAEHGLDQKQRDYNLSGTRCRILKIDRSIDLLQPGDLAVVRGFPHFDSDYEVSHFGIVPDWVFNSGLELSLRIAHAPRRVPGPYIEITGHEPGRDVERVLVEVRAEYNLHLSRMVTYDEKGNVEQELLLSDFRPVETDAPAPLMLPFKSELHRAAYGIADYFVCRRQVKSIVVNGTLPADSFATPDGYHVQDTRPGLGPAVPEPIRAQGHSMPAPDVRRGISGE